MSDWDDFLPRNVKVRVRRDRHGDVDWGFSARDHHGNRFRFDHDERRGYDHNRFSVSGRHHGHRGRFDYGWDDRDDHHHGYHGYRRYDHYDYERDALRYDRDLMKGYKREMNAIAVNRRLIKANTELANELAAEMGIDPEELGVMGYENFGRLPARVERKWLKEERDRLRDIRDDLNAEKVNERLRGNVARLRKDVEGRLATREDDEEGRDEEPSRRREEPEPRSRRRVSTPDEEFEETVERPRSNVTITRRRPVSMLEEAEEETQGFGATQRQTQRFLALAEALDPEKYADAPGTRATWIAVQRDLGIRNPSRVYDAQVMAELTDRLAQDSEQELETTRRDVGRGAGSGDGRRQEGRSRERP